MPSTFKYCGHDKKKRSANFKVNVMQAMGAPDEFGFATSKYNTFPYEDIEQGIARAFGPCTLINPPAAAATSPPPQAATPSRLPQPQAPTTKTTDTPTPLKPKKHEDSEAEPKEHKVA